MSKLGFHISAGNRRGFGEALQKCAAAGSPVPVIFSVDQDVWPDVERFSPQTTTIFRTQKNGRGATLGDGLGSMYTGDPAQTAQDWMKEMMPVWAQNHAHYYAPINEQDPALVSGFTWLNAFTHECMKIAEANGYKLALYAFSGGNPKDVPHPAIGEPFTRDQAWRELVPSLQRAKANGHILLLHEYGFNFVTLKASAPYLALRYRHAYRLLAQYDADPPLVISEASAGVGYAGIASNIWLADAQWYDSGLMQDRAIIGCCLYQLGGAENYYTLLPQLADYISRTPTPAPESGAAPVVSGPDRLADGTPVPDEEGEEGAAPRPQPTPQPAPTPTPPPPPQPEPTPAPSPAPTPRPSSGPLDFNATISRVRKDPDRPGQVIVTFQIAASGGSGEYEYYCEGDKLSGPTRDRPSTKSGAIVESYRVVSSDGQTSSKKFFFAARDFPHIT